MAATLAACAVAPSFDKTTLFIATVAMTFSHRFHTAVNSSMTQHGYWLVCLRTLRQPKGTILGADQKIFDCDWQSQRLLSFDLLHQSSRIHRKA
jgi:hypothetical protein